MIELIELLVKYLEQIPTNVVLLIIVGLMAIMFKRQEKTDKKFMEHIKESEDKFAAGNRKFTNMEEEFQRITEHLHQIHEESIDLRRLTLKILIYSDAMDYYERQAAYDEYIGLGGNGFTQRYYRNVLGPRIEEHIKQAELNKK